MLIRSVRGVSLTASGRAFLDHARLALAQVAAATVAARRASHPAKPNFALGFLTGQEMDWLPQAMHILRAELPNIEVTVLSQFSPDLAKALMSGTLDLAFMRREPNYPDLTFLRVLQEPLVVVLPSDHRLASHEAIDPRDLRDEVRIGVSSTAPVLLAILKDFDRQFGLKMADHQIDNLSMAISLVASTRGVALLPAYAKNFLPWSVVSRPIKGASPTIDLMIGYHKGNSSPLLKLFASRVDELIARVTRQLSSSMS